MRSVLTFGKSGSPGMLTLHRRNRVFAQTGVCIERELTNLNERRHRPLGEG